MSHPLLTTAVELFSELASDNLPEAEILRFNQEFNQTGLVAEVEIDPDWEIDLGEPVNDEQFGEVWIGLGQGEEFSHLFARILLSRDPEEKICHIEWLP